MLLQSCDVGCVDLVPCGHVFFHASCHAGLLAAGQGSSGFRYAFIKAAFLKFLDKQPMLALISDVRQLCCSRNYKPR